MASSCANMAMWCNSAFALFVCGGKTRSDVRLPAVALLSLRRRAGAEILESAQHGFRLAGGNLPNAGDAERTSAKA